MKHFSSLPWQQLHRGRGHRSSGFFGHAAAAAEPSGMERAGVRHRLAAPGLMLLALGALLGAVHPVEPQHAGIFEHYAVATDQPRASVAAAHVLEQGGNAADAAAAAMLALGVANPASSGLGGGGFATYYDANSKEVTFLDFRERAPAAATADMFSEDEDDSQDGKRQPADDAARADEKWGAPSQLGGLASGVPGEPAGIELLLKKFGKLERAKVVAPAIELATKGVTVTEDFAWRAAFVAPQLKRDAVMKTWFAPGTEALEQGHVFKQPQLARTLRVFARRGARPFYRGTIASAIVRANRKAGGIMSRKDLRDYKVVEREPLSAERFGYRWVTAPPPSAGGFILLGSLGLLEQWNAPKYQGGALLHRWIESWKGAHLDRQTYFGDPDHVELPLDRLMDPARDQARARTFHPTLAMPPEDYRFPLEQPQREEVVQPQGGGTSHICVVDEEGNVASITTTVNLLFGARYTAAGMVMNDEMDDFAQKVDGANAWALAGGAPNLPGPGKRPISSMSPTIVFKDEEPVLCIGASGGSWIPTATEQVAYRTLVMGMDPVEAMRAPRIHHQAVPNEVRVEEKHPVKATVQGQLAARGHAMDPTEYFVVVQMIRIDEDGERRLVAVSDARKGGAPAGK